MTGGNAYGNKDLHFGHVGGVFIHADAYARFLRDRIGPVSDFRVGHRLFWLAHRSGFRDKVAKGEASGELIDFVKANHQRQKETLDSYAIGLSTFAASALEPYHALHRDLEQKFSRHCMPTAGWSS